MPSIVLRFIALSLLLNLVAATHADAATWFVKATAQHDGNGSIARPFHTLEAAEAASGAGDIIYIIHTISAVVLDGQIVLKPDQKLIGLGPDVRNVDENAAAARITYSGGGGVNYPAGAVVQLSSGNEIANIHFKDMSYGGIVGLNVDFSGAHIHDNLFTGGDINNDFFRISVLLDSSLGNSTATVTNNVIRDGNFLAGISVFHRADSSGNYHFENNHFDNIGGRPYFFWTFDTAYVRADILDSSANNIGALGEFSEFANSDGIGMQLSQSSAMDIVIDGYTYDNTGQFGGISNTGLELFFPGQGLNPPDIWADGAQASLKIRNSSIGNAVTDAIQILSLGTNSVVDVEMTNTQVSAAKPAQVGPVVGLVGAAISIVPNFFFSDGNQMSVKIEHSDIIGSFGYAVGVYDLGSAGKNFSFDMGGGSLGSFGQNRILDNAVGDIELFQYNDGIGRLNWWGGNAPQVDGGSFDTVPELLADPRP